MSEPKPDDWKSEEWGEVDKLTPLDIYADVYLVCTVPLASPGRDANENEPTEGWATFSLGNNTKDWVFKGKAATRTGEIIKELYQNNCTYEIERIFFHGGVLDK